MGKHLSFVLFKSEQVAPGWVWWRARGGETHLSRLEEVPWACAASIMVHPGDSAEAWRQRTAVSPAEFPATGSNGPETQRLQAVNRGPTGKRRYW